MKERYSTFRFTPAILELIEFCDGIVEDYVAQGYRLTVRQIYYQLVARGKVENTVQSYDRVQAMLNRARLAGLIDWDAIEDRTREIAERSHWTDGSHMLRSAARWYHEDMWINQPTRVFVIVEKEALAGVLERTCNEFDVPLLAARGYPSATTLRELAKERIMGSQQDIVVLHLGDHDPSGIDMSRDLEERLALFSRHRTPIDFRRLALNMAQVEEQQPPPNPAKTTDARYGKYRDEYGDESWELDALTPQYLHNLVADEVKSMIEWDAWNDDKDRIQRIKRQLNTLADNFTEED